MSAEEVLNRYLDMENRILDSLMKDEKFSEEDRKNLRILHESKVRLLEDLIEEIVG